MAQRKRGTPEQQVRRALISELLSAANVQSMRSLSMRSGNSHTAPIMNIHLCCMQRGVERLL